MSIGEIAILSLGFVIIYVIFEEKEKNWALRFFMFVMVFGMFFVVKMLDGYWFLLGLIIFPFILYGVMKLIHPSENERLKDQTPIFLVMIALMVFGKLLN